MPYRPDIDGLRAIAVVSVLLYHLGLSGFEGGYVGVDVFFVISGYLITRLIVEEYHASGSFSYSRFYVRRMRRLLPALFVTLAATLLVSAILFPPSLMQSTGESALYAVLSVSNIYFWKEANYFDVEALAKPLLHTWSLSVEEQFYLLWPVVLVALVGLKSRWPLFGVLFFTAIGSLLLNLVFVDGSVSTLTAIYPKSAEWFEDGQATIFFLPIFRLFEFMIGAAIVWLVRWKPDGPIFPEALALLGLGMIGWAVFVFDEKTVFPSENALLPCIGTALLIYAGPTAYIGKLLESRPAVVLGKLSYSLYLVHWPLIVFYSQAVFRPLKPMDMVALAVASVILAVILYRCVEQPFRGMASRPRRLSNRIVLSGIVVSGLLVGGIASVAVIDRGWEWRIPEARRALTPKQWRDEETRFCGGLEKSTGLVTCAVDRGADKDIYVWGDSHARHLVGGLAQAFPERNVKVLYVSSCLPQSGLFGYFYDYEGRQAKAEKCVERNQAALQYFLHSAPTTVLLQNNTRVGHSHNETFIGATTSIIEALSAKGHEVQILSDVIRPEKMLVDCFSVPPVYSDRVLAARCVGDQPRAKALAAENKRLEALFTPDVFIDMSRFFCGTGRCVAFMDGKPLFRDHHHLTVFGAQRFIDQAIKDAAFLETDG